MHIYNRYAKKKMETKHNIKDNHKITRKKWIKKELQKQLPNPEHNGNKNISSVQFSSVAQ